MVEIRALNSARQEATGIRMVLLAVWYWISSHVSLTIAIFGALLMVIGAAVLQGQGAAPGVYEAPLQNILAGMFGVWGFSFILLGLFFDIVLRLLGAWQQRQASKV